MLTFLASIVPADQGQMQALDDLYEIAKTLPPDNDTYAPLFLTACSAYFMGSLFIGHFS